MTCESCSRRRDLRYRLVQLYFGRGWFLVAKYVCLALAIFISPLYYYYLLRFGLAASSAMVLGSLLTLMSFLILGSIATWLMQPSPAHQPAAIPYG